MIETQANDGSGNADQILASLSAANEQQVVQTEMPSAFADVPIDKFQQALKEAVGVESLDDVKLAMNAQTKLSEYEQRLKEYEAKQAVSPFANPLIEKINQVARNGADLNQIERLIYLNKIDTSQVGDFDAIKIAKGIEKPSYNTEEIDVLIERELGFSPDSYDETNPAHRVAVRELAEKARTSIQNERVSIENPEAVARAQEAQRQREAIVDGWANKVLPVVANDIKVPFAMKDENQGIDYQFEFNPSKDQLNQAMQATIATIQANPTAFPLQMDQVDNVKHLVKSFLLMMHGEDIMTSMARDAYAKATLALQQKVAGPPPQRPMANIPGIQPQQRKGSGAIPLDALY
jgi:hypothetical protein